MGGGLWGSAPVPSAFPPSCHLPHRHRRRRHRYEELFLHICWIRDKNFQRMLLVALFAKSVFLI